MNTESGGVHESYLRQKFVRGINAIIICLGMCGVCFPNKALADAESDWLARSTAPGVLMATRFDTQAEVDDWVHPNDQADHVSWDNENVASGAGSLRFEILKTDNSSSGDWRRYLSDDRRQFGTGDTFYVQFRQYIPQYYRDHVFSGDHVEEGYGGGWKQCIISNILRSNQSYEIVLQNTLHRGIVQGYSRSSSYTNWDESISTPCSGADFLYQDRIDGLPGVTPTTCLQARQKYGGLYSYGAHTGAPDPESPAFPYYPDEWVTYYLKITPGSFDGDGGPEDSAIDLWAARDGDTEYTHLYSKMVNLGNDTGDGLFDAIWLLPYHTDRLADPTRQDTYTLYDELIVSTQFIPAPNSPPVGPNSTRPAPITDLVAE